MLSSAAAEHLTFCKNQALAVLQVNLVGDAWANFVKNLNLHPETKMGPAKFMSSMMIVELLTSPKVMLSEVSPKEKMKEFIKRYDPNSIGLG